MDQNAQRQRQPTSTLGLADSVGRDLRSSFRGLWPTLTRGPCARARNRREHLGAVAVVAMLAFAAAARTEVSVQGREMFAAALVREGSAAHILTRDLSVDADLRVCVK